MKTKVTKRLFAWIMSFAMVLSVLAQGGGSFVGMKTVKAADDYDINNWSVSAKSFISGGDALTSCSQDDVQYTGKEWTVSDLKLIKGTNDDLAKSNYTVSYENNINAGKAKIIIKGTGDYTGTIEYSFVINPATSYTGGRLYISVDGTSTSYKQTSTTRPTVTYYKNGTNTNELGVEPEIKLCTNSACTTLAPLVYGTDYTVTYVNNDELASTITSHTASEYADSLNSIDTPYVIIHLIGNHDVYYYRDFKIAAGDISESANQVTAKLIGSTFAYTGKEVKPSVTITDNKTGSKLYEGSGTYSGHNMYDYSVTYSNNINPGTATVTITGAGRYTGTITKTFTIQNGGADTKDLENATITVGSATYTGSGVEPTVTVTYGGTTLKEGTDYELSFDNNINAGSSAKVTVSALGSTYIGTKSKNFTIAAKSIKDSSISIAEVNASYAYGTYPSGSVPVITDTTRNKKLTYTEDFSISGTSGTAWKVGDYTLNVSGTGNYKESTTFTLHIKPLDITNSLNVDIDPVTYSGTAVTPVPKKVYVAAAYPMTSGTDYEITGYENNDKAGEGTILITGKGNYTGTAAKKFTINLDASLISIKDSSKVSIVAASSATSYKYTGGQIKPEYNLTNIETGEALVLGTDYEVTYGANKNLGTNAGSVTIKGIGKYSDSTTKYFNIVRRDMTDKDIQLNLIGDPYEYTGEEIMPKYTLKLFDYSLVEGTDYTIRKETNQDYSAPGEHYIWLTGKGNFTTTSEKKVTYTILGPSGSLSDVEITGLPESVEYTGAAIVPELTLKYNDYELTSGTDYEIEISGNDKIGTASITITGLGTFAGERKLEFEITAKDLENCDIKLGATSFTYTGKAIEPAVTAKNGTVTMKKGTDYTVVVTDNTNVGPAKVTITAVKGGNYTGEVELNFNITKVYINNSSAVNFSNPGNNTHEYTGDAIKPEITGRWTTGSGTVDLIEGEDFEVTYGENTEVGTDEGTVEITGIGNFTGTVNKKFTISKKNINNCTIEEIGKQNWTGKPVEPVITILNGKTELVLDEDFTVEYQLNTDETDKAVAVVTGTGAHYTGEKTLYFVISKNVLGIDDESVSVAKVADQTYNFGNAITPSVKITVGEDTLTEGKDYSLSYSGNKNVGTATITISGLGGYSGSRTTTFAIKPYDVTGGTLNLSSESEEYTGSQIKVDATSIKIDGKIITDLSGFDVTYGENTEVGTGTVTLTAKAKGNYSGSVNAEFDIEQKDISKAVVTPANASEEYTGEKIEPSVTVTLDGSELPDSAYEVDYQDNVNTGTATITVTGTGNYKGSATGTFEITGIDISGVTVSDIEDQEYTGSEILPSFTVKLDETVLAEDTDYVIEKKENLVNVSKEGSVATITLRGKGNYSGTKKVTFNIVPTSLEAAKVDGISESETYTGSAITFDLSVTLGKTELVLNEDYTVAYENNINVSSAKVVPKITISGTGNYKGSIEKTFAIVPKDIEDLTYSDIPAQTYTKSAITPEVKVSDGSKVLVNKTDYTVTYKDNTDPTTETQKASIIISGTGNYTGTKTLYFDIVRVYKKIADVKVADIAAKSYNYGKEITPSLVVTYGEDELVLGTDYTVEFENNKNAGTALYTITGIGDFQGEKNGSFTINPLSIEGYEISGTKDVSYTGEAHEFNITVSDGTHTLEKTDYQEVYTDNIKPGTGKVTVTGTGNYTGSIYAEFGIGKVSISGAEIKLSTDSFIYTGSEIKATISEIKLKDGTTVTSADKLGAEVTYKNNINKGTATITVTATASSNYSGSCSTTYTINQASIERGILSVSDASYTGSEVIPKYSFSLAGYTLDPETDYDVSFADNDIVGTASITVTGKGNFTGKVSKYFNINAISLSEAVITVSGTYEYTGSEITPAYTVTLDGKTLKLDEDFETTITNNINAGTANISIEGIGNYSGTAATTFAIGSKNIKDVSVSGYEEKVSYKAEAWTFDITVSDGTKELVADKDYTVSYKNNISTTSTDKKAEIVITGKGNYTGNKSVYFDIEGIKITKSDVTGLEDKVMFTGSAIRFEKLSVSAGGRTLILDTDYTVSYTNNINASTDTAKAKVTITGIGAYSETVEHEFVIEKRSMNDAQISDIPGQIWTGKEVTPDVTVKMGDVTLVKDRDYELTYDDNIDVTDESHAVVYVTGKGNYYGVINAFFDISYDVKNINVCDVTFANGTSYEYAFGEAIEPAVKVMDGETELELDKQYTVSYSKNINAGTATVTVTGKREYSGSISKEFTITAYDIKDADVYLDEYEYNFTGQQIKPAVVYLDIADEKIEDLSEFKITYANNINVGTATVTITANAGTNFTGSVSETFYIHQANIEDATVSVSDQVYTGSEIKPVIVVYFGETQLKNNVDFVVSYDLNTNVGKANVFIDGKGNFDGLKTTSFNITEKSIAQAIVTLEKESYVFTGDEIYPAVTVTLDGKTLNVNEDYAVTYSNNVNPGTGNITIKGIENYSGNISKEFEITAASLKDAKIVIASGTYTGSAVTPEFAVYLGEKEIPSEYYTAEWNNNINATSEGSKAQVIITGKELYADSVSADFDIAPASIKNVNISGKENSLSYTGKEVTQNNVKLTYNDFVLVKDKDYVVTYKDNVEVGTATITITGLGNYAESIEDTYAITKMNISGCQVEDIPGQKYSDGKAITPAVVVKNGDSTLVLDTDYTVSYKDNTDIGTATVVITGAGNYTGETSVTFTISRDVEDISSAKIDDIADQVYNFGNAIEPKVSVKLGSKTLALGTDYKVAYSENVNAGTATVTVTGLGYYTGTVSAEFTILPYTLDNTNSTLSIEPEEFIYNGDANEANVKAIDIANKVTLDDLSDFVITYASNTEVGTAKVTATAKEGTNFTGSVSKEYAIVAKSILPAEVKVENPTYTGDEVSPKITVSMGSTTLSLETDYDLLVEKGINVGEYAFTISGKGNYSGKIEKTYSVVSASIKTAEIVVSDQVYEGSEVTPEIKVVMGGKTLVNEKDYTVSFADNNKVGVATVTVTGTGNYKDSVSQTFNIAGYSIEKCQIEDIADQTYTGESITPAVKITNGTQTLVLGVDYKVIYNLNLDVTDSAEVVITGLGNYAGTAKKQFAIVPKNINQASVSGYSKSVTYTGSAITFENISVVLDGHNLDLDDYDIEYTGNVNPTENEGTYFTLTGKGNYTGTNKVIFQILKKSIEDCTVEEIESQIYVEGKASEPEVVVKNGAITLVRGTDFDVTYEGNTSETTAAKAIITGKGNYEGTVAKTFVISKTLVDLSNATISDIEDQTYNMGAEVKPAVTVTLSGKTLKEAVDYKVTYDNNVNVGTAKVIITGIGSYKGSVEKEFAILAMPINGGSVTLKNTSATYTGSAITPSVTEIGVKSGESVIVIKNLSDFTVEYSDNVNVGTAKVVITAKSGTNFTGSAEGTFEIAPLSIENAEVTVTGAEYTGEIIIPDVTVVLGGKTLVLDTDYTVSIDEDVNVTSEAKVTVTGKGNYTGEVNETFAITAKSIEGLTIVVEDQPYTGSAITPVLDIIIDGVALKINEDYVVEYSNNTLVSTEDKKAQIVVKGINNYSGRVTASFSIVPNSISGVTVEAIPAQTYTGSEINPKVTVRDGSMALVQGRDFTVEYKDNVEKSKKAKVIITGIGNYTGSIEVTFEICETSIASGYMLGASNRAEYTGKEITFDGVSVYYGGTKLTENVDYTISYENNINVSTTDSKAYVVATGMGNYGGELRYAFDIIPIYMYQVTVSDIPNQGYTGAEVKPEVTVKYGDKTLKAGTDYEVTYSNNVEVGYSAQATITGKGNYAGTVTKQFVITAQSIKNAVVNDIADQEYTGSEIKPEVVVTMGGNKLEEGVDYRLEYKTNVNVGDKAEVVIYGMGNFGESITKNFTITPKDIKDAVISGVTNMSYTGSAITFNSLQVTLDGQYFGTDNYTVSYSNNTAVGTAKVTITGKGNYKGTASKEFEIEAVNVENQVIVNGVPAEKTYNGKNITIDGIVVIYNGVTLKSGTDYDITYSNNKNVTTENSLANVIITFKGNYTGKVTKTFAIVPCDIKVGKIADIKNQGYTGSAITPDVVVNVNGVKLTANDYDVEYSNNVNIGTAKVVVTGKGGYTGSLESSFVIVPAQLKNVKWISSKATTNSATISWDAVDGAEGYIVSLYNESTKTYTKLADTKENTYTATGLSAGTNIKLSVCVYITSATGTISGIGTDVTCGTVPAAVTGIKNSASAQTVKVTWNKVTGATGYIIEKYNESTKKYEEVRKQMDVSYTFTGLAEDTSYKYRVSAYRVVNGVTLTGAATDGSAKTLVSAPPQVKNLKLLSRGTNTLTIKWDVVSNASGYEVYKAVGSGTYSLIKDIKNTSTVKFISSKLKAGKKYSYKVRAYRKSGDTKVYGAFAELTTITKPGSSVIAVKAKSKKAVVGWKRVSGADGYVIYMSTSKNGKFKKVGTVKKGRKPRFTKKKLKSKKTYYFKVRAYKVFDGKRVYGAYSTIKKVKVK